MERIWDGEVGGDGDGDGDGMGWDDVDYRMGLLYVPNKRGIVDGVVYVLWMTVRGKDIERWKQGLDESVRSWIVS